jgi:hypothetical protein
MTTSPMTSTEIIAALDPHGLADAGEPTATAAELHARFGIGAARLRWLRRRRLVRYVDHYPGMPAGTGPLDRYAYSVTDVERARPAPPKSPEAPPPPPPTLPEPRRHTAATLRGPMPEVVIMRRRVGGARP